MQVEVERWLEVAAKLEKAAVPWVQPTCQQATEEVHCNSKVLCMQCMEAAAMGTSVVSC